MKILAVGDVVGTAGLNYLKRRLRKIKQMHQIDFTIVNGENAAGVGIFPAQADDIWDAGADIITLGNHIWNKRQIIPYLDDQRYLLRPANLAPQAPGRGWGIFDGASGERVLVINLIGRCEMQFGPDNPFLCVDKILRETQGQYDIAICEIHTSATSEKLAMGFYLDGRVSAVYGTHTHVQTADQHINPKGTGYITDIGMTGPVWSVLGVKPEQSIALFRGDVTETFQTADGKCALGGIIFTVDSATKQCTKIERIWDCI